MLLTLSALLACAAPAPPAATSQPPTSLTSATLDPDDPGACAPCHASVVREWERSMHSRSHQDSDPIYAAMRALRRQKQGDAVADTCDSCHAPRARSAPASPAALAGVSCAACHAVEAVDRDAGAGALALITSDGALYGPHDLSVGANPVHGTGAAPAHMTDGRSLCLACHDAVENAAGVPACTTGPEHAAAEAPGGCVGCHMPRVEGPSGAVSTRGDHASHEFFGPHHAWSRDDASFLATAVAMEAAFQGDLAVIALENRAAHAYPTGFPGRMALVVVEGLGGDGQVLWRNFTDDPMAQSPGSVLNKVYVDADGAPVPAAFAAALKRDSRLAPGETRTLSYAVPPQVVALRASLVFRLLPPPLAETLGLSEAPESSPRVAATATAAR